MISYEGLPLSSKKMLLKIKKRFEAFKIIYGMPNKGVTLTIQKSSLLS